MAAQRVRTPARTAASRTPAAARASRVAPARAPVRGTTELSAIVRRAPRPAVTASQPIRSSAPSPNPSLRVASPSPAFEPHDDGHTAAPPIEEPVGLAEKTARWLFDQGLAQAGIPPASFWALMGRIRHVVPDILRDPLGFAQNLLIGVGEGVRGFFERIGTHLLKGLLDWLTRGLGGTGVELPKDASPGSLITFFLQVMGITWDRIRGLAARRVGEKKLALIERVWRVIALLEEQGPAGLYQLVKDRLEPRQLIEPALTTARDTVVAAVVPPAMARIVALFNPVGAIAQAVMAVYKALQWIFHHAARLFSLVETVVAGMADIVAGNVSGLARKIEQVLARLVGPLIDLLMRYLSLGDLPERIGAALKAMQQRVEALLERAIDWVIEKARKLWGDVKEAAGRLWRWWQQKKKFSDRAGAEHTLFFEGQGPSARLMVRSNLTSFTELVAQTPEDPAKRTARIAALAVGRSMDTIRARALPDGSLPKLEQAPFAALMDKLAVHLAVLMASDDSSSKPVYGPLTKDGGFGTSMVILRLTKGGKGLHGSRPDPEQTKHWSALRKRRYGGGKGLAQYYIPGHLLNEKLGGPGNTWHNLVPLNQYTSNLNEHNKKVEEKIKERLTSPEVVVRYEVTAIYPRENQSNNAKLLGILSAKGELDRREKVIQDILLAEQHIPARLLCSASTLSTTGKSAEIIVFNRTPVKNLVEDASLGDYVVDEKPVIRLVSLNINECIAAYRRAEAAGDDHGMAKYRGALMELHEIGKARAGKLVAHGPFASWQAIPKARLGITDDIVNEWKKGTPGGASVSLDKGKTRWEE